MCAYFILAYDEKDHEENKTNEDVFGDCVYEKWEDDLDQN